MRRHCQAILAVIKLSMASACASNSYQGPIEYFDAEEDQGINMKFVNGKIVTIKTD